VVNSTFSGNAATGGGGGILNNAGTATIQNSTFVNNSASGGGGGIGTWNSPSSPNTYIGNTILMNNTGTSSAPDDCRNGLGTGTLGGTANIIGATTNCTSIATYTTGANLGTLTGSPAYYPLLPGSAAIDTGDSGICTATAANYTSENNVPRPQDGNNDTISVCDIGAYELPASRTLNSSGALDGWVLESTETSGVGGSLNATNTTFSLGDDASNRQYRAILSFDTHTLPGTAVITSVTLKIKRPATGFLVGDNNPFAWGGGLKADVCKGFFSTTSALQLGDFNFTSINCKVPAATFSSTPSLNWYSANLASTAFAKINRLGLTQFRLRFNTDDNNDHTADYLNFFSGNSTAANRPTLIIYFYMP
jgi:hypothetical protein